jgi:ribosomal-protein-alanine N-acetyltransferase
MIEHIIPLTSEHHDAVWRIEQQAHDSPWAESMIRAEPNRFAINLVLVDDEIVIGYCFGQVIVGEGTLLNIAIDPDYQGKGYGKRLLMEFISKVQQTKGDEIWLEVRESNKNAYHLYESLGFNEINRRVGYYPAPQGREDALVMTLMIF